MGSEMCIRDRPSPTEVMDEEVEEVNEETGEEQQLSPPEGQDTHQTPQKLVVIAIIDTERIRGIVWRL